ncbi:MAG: alpha/beta hydrolase [bacterium]|nr:alpha/beta hydrolase [bacterium]
MILKAMIAKYMRYFILAQLTLLFSNEAFALWQEKTIRVDGGQIKYFQIGSGQPVLLLHGLFANKEQWLGLIQQLIKNNAQITSKFQFIVPDLPGYAQSTGYPVEAYNLDNDTIKPKSLNQVTILHDFMNQLHIRAPIHLAGNSMGGLIMTLYTVHYPREVKSLTYMGSPLGISDLTSKLINSSFRRGYNPFTPTTLSQFHNELSLLLINYAAIMPSDEYIKTKILPPVEKNFQTLTAAFNNSFIPYYRDYLKKPLTITQPVIIFWGDKDYIFGNIRHAKQLCHNLVQSKKCSWHAIPDAGHLLMMENQKTLNTIAHYYEQFLSGKGPS